jgi:hypothetical protein
MNIVFAKNQTLVCFGANPTVVYSDPVPLGRHDRLACICTVHSIDKNTGGGTPQMVYTAQASNDGGQTYKSPTAVTDTVSATGSTQKVGAVNAALVRFQFLFQNTEASSTDVAAICFDLHVVLDHA